jgi:hypothetical protein
MNVLSKRVKTWSGGPLAAVIIDAPGRAAPQQIVKSGS